MQQPKPSSLKPPRMPPYVADAGKIVVGAGVRLPTVKVPAASPRNVVPGVNQKPA